MKLDEEYLRSISNHVVGCACKYVKLEDALEVCEHVRMEQGCIEEASLHDHGEKCYNKALDDLLLKMADETFHIGDVYDYINELRR